MLVGSRALARARIDADRPAIRDAAGTLTAGDLAGRFELVRAACAQWPRAHDDDAGYVAMAVDGSADTLVTVLGVMSAGWAVGVLDPQWTGGERASALAQLSPDVLIGVDPADGQWVTCGQIGGRPVACRHRSGPCGPRTPTADDIFYVGFTSGSSGVPKAFERTHDSWWRSFVGLDALVALGAGSVLIPGPLSSSHFLFGALHGLHAGALVELLAGGGSGPRIAERLNVATPVAAMYVVPSMLQQLADCLDTPPPVQPDVIFCAGARLDQATRDVVGTLLPRSTVVEYYGASELSFVAIRIDGDGTPAGSVGRAFPGVDITIRDMDGGTCAAGEPGRIFVQSPLVFSGYRGQAPTGGAELLDGGWWTVGDRGYLDDDGNLYVAGRGSSLIIVGGANVQPEEIEQVLATVPGVIGCAVVGVDDPRWGQVPVAVVTAAPGLALTRSQLRGAVGEHLARHKRPRRYVLLDALPLGRTGKVDRERVRAVIDAGGGDELR